MNTLDYFAMAIINGIMASKQTREPHHHAQDVNDAFDIAEKMIEERAKRYSENRPARRRTDSPKQDAPADADQKNVPRTRARRRKPTDTPLQEQEMAGPEGLEPPTQ